MVLRRCRFLLGEEDQALDTTHDVFVQLLRHRERLSGEHPSSLLYTIATRLSLNAGAAPGRVGRLKRRGSAGAVASGAAHLKRPPIPARATG